MSDDTNTPTTSKTRHTFAEWNAIWRARADNGEVITMDDGWPPTVGGLKVAYLRLEAAYNSLRDDLAAHDAALVAATREADAKIAEDEFANRPGYEGYDYVCRTVAGKIRRAAALGGEPNE